jgi:hypothetical protein
MADRDERKDEETKAKVAADKAAAADEADDEADDDDDEDDEADAREVEKKTAPAAKRDEKRDDDDGDDDEGDDDDGDEGDDDEPAKPAPKAAPAKPEQKPAAKPAAKRTAVRGKPRVVTKPPPKKGSFVKSMILFVVIVGGLAGALAILGREQGQGGPPQVNWKDGETVDVEITLVATDKNDLACAFPDELKGKHCAFEAEGKKWSKTQNNDDKSTLKPYTTVNRIQFLAAGMWDDPALKGQLPKGRFSVKCKYTVDGKAKEGKVRWSATENKWFQAKDWYYGSVSGCQVTK